MVGAVETLRTRARLWRPGQAARVKARDFVVRSRPARSEAIRDDLAFRYLRGDGIEIGALNHPQRVPKEARVTYVDVASAEDLVANIDDVYWAREVDVIDDGARLEKFADESLDFLMAHHMLEHVEDPIGALETFLRVVRPGGIIFLTLPDARHSFDKPRERTTVEHLLRDHREGPEVSRRDHYAEWARYIDGAVGDDIEKLVDEYAAADARHHFHVWELETFVGTLLQLGMPVEIESAQVTEVEFSVVLRKNLEPAWRAVLSSG